MALRERYSLTVRPKKLCKQLRNFVVNNHYSRSYRSLMQEYVFTLQEGSEVIGIAVYGKPCGKNVRTKYGHVLELRKLCLIDDTPKNSESYFIGMTLRWLKKNTNYDGIISYADPNFKHKGTIYKASNFEYLGEEAAANPRAIRYGSKLVHIRQYYDKDSDGNYSKQAMKWRDLVSAGEAKIVKRKKKYVFYYKLRK